MAAFLHSADRTHTYSTLYGNGDVVQCPALPELGSERKAFLKVKWLAKVGLIVMSRQGESGESGRTSYQTVRVM